MSEMAGLGSGAICVRHRAVTRLPLCVPGEAVRRRFAMENRKRASCSGALAASAPRSQPLEEGIRDGQRSQTGRRS